MTMTRESQHRCLNAFAIFFVDGDLFRYLAKVV